MPTGNAGAPWTLEEERRLYEETGDGLSLAGIAAAHGRTAGGIRARQRRMGLRDESGALVSPLPAFCSALKGNAGHDVTPATARKRRPPQAPTPELGVPVPWPHDFPHRGSWTEKLWSALRHDVEMLLRDGRLSEPMAARAIGVVLARLTPGDDLHPAVNLSALGSVHGVSRERIRQIHQKALRRLAIRVQKAGSLTRRVLDMMAEAAPGGHAQGPASWFALELARQDCRPAFTEFMLTAFLGRDGFTRKDARSLVGKAMGPIRALRTAETSSDDRRNEGDGITQRARRANAFVLGILKKAVWPERLDGQPVDLSGVRPLRDCRYERPYYARTLQRLVGYDSMGERRLIRELDLCTVVTEFVEQPAAIGYRLDGRDHVYVPDLLVRLDADLFFVIEIKGRNRLADRTTLAKAEAARRHLGERGIGYCLTDADGFGLGDLRALEPDASFTQRLEDLLQRHGTVKRKVFEQAFAPERRRWAYDQLQAAVLRGGLIYDTRLIERRDLRNHYIFDFRLRAASPLP